MEENGTGWSVADVGWSMFAVKVCFTGHTN
jgi:hypothetical protein